MHLVCISKLATKHGSLTDLEALDSQLVFKSSFECLVLGQTQATFGESAAASAASLNWPEANSLSKF